ncbi:MAG: hypothetical protein ABSF21_04160 [Dehalococcoidia bacterium]
MGKRYFIEFSRKDIGLVSYFPGIEITDDPEADWIDEVLVPAVEPIAKRKAAKIRDMPITFWVTIRRTARRPAEIFLFATPAYPGVTVERALSQALECIKNGKVHAGREPIPEEAVACLQIFRGRLIRFYGILDGYEGFYLPAIRWQDNAPELALLPIPENDELIAVDVPIEKMERPLAEARILSVSNGESCRKFQQALIPVAMQAE